VKKKLLLLFLFVLPSFLIAGVKATYTTYPLHLESYNDIYSDVYGGTGTNHYQNLIAMPLGRFTIDTQGETIRTLALLSNISSEFSFRGRTNWNPTTTDSVGFHPVAILKYGSQLYNSNLNQGSTNPINPTNTPMTGVITIDFYLVSHNPASVFIENEQYTHESGTVGTFSVAFSSENIGFWNADFDPVVDENGQPIPEQPYLQSGTITPEEDVPYGDPLDNVLYSFTIINNQDNFDLSSAFGVNKAFIATAQVTLNNANPTEVHGVTLTFTSQTNTDPFRMRLVGGSDSQFIEYKLFFNNRVVVPGNPVDWEGLSNGTFTKDIKVTQIKQSDVEELPEGTYSDTIIVNLTPKDSM